MDSTPFYTIFFVPACTTSFQVDHQLGGVQEVVGVVVVGGGAVVALGKGVAGQGPLYQLALRQGSKQRSRLMVRKTSIFCSTSRLDWFSLNIASVILDSPDCLTLSNNRVTHQRPIV